MYAEHVLQGQGVLQEMGVLQCLHVTGTVCVTGTGCVTGTVCVTGTGCVTGAPGGGAEGAVSGAARGHRHCGVPPGLQQSNGKCIHTNSLHQSVCLPLFPFPLIHLLTSFYHSLLPHHFLPPF